MLCDSDDEYCYRDRATNVESLKSEHSMSLSTGCGEVVIDTTSTTDHTELIEQTPLTDRIEHELQGSQHHSVDRNQPSITLDSITAHANMNVSDTKEGVTILSPPSFRNDVTESDFDAVVPSSSMLVSLSHNSPDSGIYSKAVSNSLVTSMSTVTETLDITTDLFKSTDDKLSSVNVSAALHTKINSDSFDGSVNSDPLHQTVDEPLPASTEMLQSTCLDDTDDQNTTVDVRSSIMSTNTDGEVDQTIVGAGEQVLCESLDAVTSDEHVKRKDGDSEVDDVCLPADQHVSCLGYQEPSGLSDSDADDEAVLKTVVAVHTKAVDRSECVDSIQHFEPEEKSDSDVLRDSSLGLGKINVESMEEQSSCGDPNVDNSLTVYSDLQHVNASGSTVNSLLAENSDATGCNSVMRDGVGDVAAEISPSANEQLSTLSTELDQYMTECALQATDTSIDSQVLDYQQISDLIASVKIFSENEDLGNDFASRRSHPRTRSFTKADYSVPSSQSGSPGIPASTEMRRHSCTPSSPRPLDVVEQVCGLSSEHQCRELWQDSENATVPLTASMEDLKLRPSKKKLEFDGLPRASTPLFVLEPPDEYRDQPMSTEDVGSSVSPNVTDLCTDACRPPVGLNMQAKKDHLERYLKSLATMPGCESMHEVLDTDLVQENNYAGRFDREYAIDLPCQERSTSLLLPNLLHQSDSTGELTDDECLEVQLEQYEIMKQHLMEEHQRSLEQLLAEQERQMSLLQSRLMGHTLFSNSSPHSRTVKHVPSTLAMPLSEFERCEGTSLPLDVPGTFHRQLNEMQSTSRTTADLHQQSISDADRHVEALVVSEMSSNHKIRSPAGVFYTAQQVVSREPSCSTIRSDDTESEFAYKSPAVLRGSRRLTPTCSPQDGNKMQIDSSLHSLMPTQDSPPHISAGPERSPVYARRLDRRYVDMFSEASL